MITPPLSLLGRLGRIGRVALVLAFACALIPLTAHAEPAVSTKHPAGTMVQTERGPAFIPFDGAAYNASEGAATFAALPEKYDLRNVDGASFVTSVKNQGVYGDCWAFGTLSSLESNLLKTGKAANVDLSERHLAWFTYNGTGYERRCEPVGGQGHVPRRRRQGRLHAGWRAIQGGSHAHARVWRRRRGSRPASGG